MTIAHTPEPWDSYDSGPADTGGDGICVGSGPALIADNLTDANAKRIVACVNACAGFPDPAAAIEALRAVFYTGAAGNRDGAPKACIARSLFDRIRAMVEAADAATNR